MSAISSSSATSPTAASASAAGSRAALQREGDIVADRQRRIERIALERHGDAALAPAAESWIAPPSRRIVPSLTSSKPAIMRRVEVLPQPDEPSKRNDLAALDVEVEIFDRDDGLLAARPIDLVDAVR